MARKSKQSIEGFNFPSLLIKRTRLQYCRMTKIRKKIKKK